MDRATERWYSARLEQDIGFARWGHYGRSVLLFPTADGDAEEAERNGLIEACRPLVDGGRVTLYSCDSVAGRAMLARAGSPDHLMWLFSAFHECVVHEVVPAIHADSGEQLVVTAGASIGAYNALGLLCRYPQLFGAAICMSGTYGVEKFFDGPVTQDLYLASPTHFVPGLPEGPHLDTLRQRFAVIASGQGAWENVGESWHAGRVLGSRGLPNRVDAWSEQWEHDWPTWHRMLPQYLDELC